MMFVEANEAVHTSRHCLNSGSRSPMEACAVRAPRMRIRVRERNKVQNLPLCVAMATASTTGDRQAVVMKAAKQRASRRFG